MRASPSRWQTPSGGMLEHCGHAARSARWAAAHIIGAVFLRWGAAGAPRCPQAAARAAALSA
eukprot:10355290-Lingulodinium_polyedra.AAC.1